MRKLLSSLLLLSTFAFAAPPQPVGLPVYHPHAEALRAMFFDTHTRGGSGGSSYACCTDTGTAFQSTEPFVSPNGTATAPGFGVGGSNTGFYRASTEIGITMQGSTAYAAFTTNNSGGLTIFNGGGLFWNSAADAIGGSRDLSLKRRGAANLQLGFADANGTPVDQTISVQNAITGSDLPGGHFTIDAPLGTGLGAASKTSINRAIMKATGATAQTPQNAFAVGQSKTLSNTSATAQTVATITLGSNAGGGAGGTFTLVCTDGTNFDSETQAFTVSFVNKATVVTVGTPAITTSTAANNSGSCTLGITAVANGNNIDIKVTPVFGTIVPTTVTLYPIITHSTNTVTFN